MIATNLRDVNTLHQAARNVGVRVENLRPMGRRWAFVLRLGPDKRYQRLSPSGRKVAAVCWHGHAAFFRELFKLDKNVEVRTNFNGKTHYTASNFEETYKHTGHQNIGSQVNPCAYMDACVADSHPPADRTRTMRDMVNELG